LLILDFRIEGGILPAFEIAFPIDNRIIGIANQSVLAYQSTIKNQQSKIPARVYTGSFREEKPR